MNTYEYWTKLPLLIVNLKKEFNLSVEEKEIEVSKSLFDKGKMIDSSQSTKLSDCISNEDINCIKEKISALCISSSIKELSKIMNQVKNIDTSGLSLIMNLLVNIEKNIKHEISLLNYDKTKSTIGSEASLLKIKFFNEFLKFANKIQEVVYKNSNHKCSFLGQKRHLNEVSVNINSFKYNI